MNPDVDTLATALYVTIDDALIDHPEWAPERPKEGIAPKLCDAELITLAVIQALLGYTSQARFIGYAHTHLRPWFPYLPERPGHTLIADKGYRRASFETELNHAGITLIRPNLKTEKSRPGRRYLKAFRQTIESVNQTFKAQLDLERHDGRTKPSVCASPPTHPRPLAQRNDQPTRPRPITDRLRPLTPWN